VYREQRRALTWTLCHVGCCLQALQQDKEHLQRQLLRCTPGEFDRLHNELLVAMRSAAELAIVQEQLARHKQLWSEAEQRLAELQVRAGTPDVLTIILTRAVWVVWREEQAERCWHPVLIEWCVELHA
jgi:hypothetical protein